MLGLGVARVRRSPAGLFTAGEQGVWYDPSDFSTLFQDSAGTTPVTAVEQPVGKMLDKSGRGNHATQATAASRPILKQDGNGKYYLLFDGVDDGMATGSIDFTATDKMTVFAGVRKLSDAVAKVLVELSVTSDTNNGSFGIFAPGGTATPNYVSVLRGTAITNIASTVYASPITNVISVSLDISGSARATEIFPRVNGAIGATVGGGSADAGAGNFGNYPLFIGRRNNTSLPLNGHLYSLIVRGAQSSAAQITSAETYVNGKTGAY